MHPCIVGAWLSAKGSQKQGQKERTGVLALGYVKMTTLEKGRTCSVGASSKPEEGSLRAHSSRRLKPEIRLHHSLKSGLKRVSCCNYHEKQDAPFLRVISATISPIAVADATLAFLSLGSSSSAFSSSSLF